MNIRTNFCRFIKGFGYAAKGLLYCVKNERNMRFHVGAGFYVLFFMRFFQLETSEKALVYIAIALVIALEAVNTAVESTVNLICGEKKHPLAKLAKDAAAGGVLVAALCSVAVGFAVFWDMDGFKAVFDYFSQNIFMLILLAISVVLWILWVLTADNEKDKDNKHD